jgi:hypothetical protein
MQLAGLGLSHHMGWWIEILISHSSYLYFLFINLSWLFDLLLFSFKNFKYFNFLNII